MSYSRKTTDIVTEPNEMNQICSEVVAKFGYLRAVRQADERVLTALLLLVRKLCAARKRR